MSSREFHWRVDDQEITCRIDESKDHAVFHMSGKAVPFTLLSPTEIEIAGKRHRFYVVHNRESTTVWLNGRTFRLQRAKRVSDSQADALQSSGEIRALMPGKLVQLSVAVGDTVSEKQTVAIMESMKMESPLVAPKAGRVSEIRFKPGEVLDMGEVVMVIE